LNFSKKYFERAKLSEFPHLALPVAKIGEENGSSPVLSQPWMTVIPSERVLVAKMRRNKYTSVTSPPHKYS
jgi:hypothetical protein